MLIRKTRKAICEVQSQFQIQKKTTWPKYKVLIICISSNWPELGAAESRKQVAAAASPGVTGLPSADLELKTGSRVDHPVKTLSLRKMREI